MCDALEECLLLRAGGAAVGAACVFIIMESWPVRKHQSVVELPQRFKLAFVSFTPLQMQSATSAGQCPPSALQSAGVRCKHGHPRTAASSYNLHHEIANACTHFVPFLKARQHHSNFVAAGLSCVTPRHSACRPSRRSFSALLRHNGQRIPLRCCRG